MTQTPAPTTRVRIVIDVEYPGELSAGGSGGLLSGLINGLNAQLDSAVGSGLLNGPAGEHLPDTWSARVTDVTGEISPPSEGTIGNWLSCQIEDGHMSLEDVPLRMERYGLMDPQDFLAEMQERMGPAFDE